MADKEHQVPEGMANKDLEPHLEVDALGPIVPGLAHPIELPKPEEPAGEPEAPRLPRAEYEVVVSKREEPESAFTGEQDRPVAEDGGGGKKGAGKVSQVRSSGASLERTEKLANSQTKIYAAVGIGLGLVVGLAAAVVLLRPGDASGSNDMSAVTAAQYGLKGYLTTNWKDNRLGYQLTIEPDGPEHRAGFVADVNRSARPLSVTVQAKDPFGAVLCSDTILLRFDPGNAVYGGKSGSTPNAEKAAQELAARNEIAKGIDLGRLEEQELDRERGKNLFENDMGADGQVASISAQGVLPCQKKDVDRFASWGFTSDFPIVAKPTSGQDVPADPKANVNTAAAEEEAKKAAEAAKAEAAAGAKLKKKPAPPPLTPIFVEGDDQIVWVDPSGGVVETNGGKALILDKGDKLGAVLKTRDLPVGIHYRCSAATGCAFSVVGLGMHHARMRQ